jgi:chemotaxis protein MotB
MGTQSNAAPVIIKRKKVIAGGGHHGGAWKVAYADFVTAMMAFFMLMWLLNATTENQRKGLADYFTPTVAINRVSGGGDGAFGGDTIFSEDVLPRMGTGASSLRPTESDRARGAKNEDGQGKAELQNVQEVFDAMVARSGIPAETLRHIATRMSDEGLVIELFDLPDAYLFDPQTDQATDLLKDLASLLRTAFDLVINPVAIEGHVESRPVVFSERPMWRLSTSRADRMRVLLQDAGLDEMRLARVVGHADRVPASLNPMAVRNNRLEVILLLMLD